MTYNRTAEAQALLSEIEDWCARTDTRETIIGHVLFLHPGFVGLMRKRLQLSEEREPIVRQFLTDNPDGWSGILPKTHANGTQPVGRASSPSRRRQEVMAMRRLAEKDRASALPRVNRDPCPRCGARADAGCGHEPTRLGTSL